MSKVYNNISETIGNTPLVKLNNLTDENSADVYVKLEFMNPGSSVKDRIALAMIEAAEKEGKLTQDTVIVEPTSGNTGIGLAMVAASKGYKATLVMPDTMSKERRALMKAYGAQLELTPGADGMPAANARAEELASQPGHFMPSQFTNPANPAVHEKTTGPEILEAFGGESPDAFVVGIGTGGTITGAGKVLKEKKEDVELIAVEPVESAVLSGKEKGPHKIQGLGAGFIPEVLDTDLYTEVLTVSSEEAMDMTRRLAREEGLLVGVSAGANVVAAIKVAERLGSGKQVLTVAPDTGERYLTAPVFAEEE